MRGHWPQNGGVPVPPNAMPIYAFACNNCGHQFDKLQKLSDPDPDTCPACGATGTVHRRLTAPQFRLAGGGWYETDFKSDQEGKRNLAGSDDAPPADEGKKDKATSTPSDAKAEKKADAKPVAKPAGKPAAKARPAARAKARPKAAKPAKKKARR